MGKSYGTFGWNFAGSLSDPRNNEGLKCGKSNGISRGCLHGGASLKVEKARFAADKRVRRTAKIE